MNNDHLFILYLADDQLITAQDEEGLEQMTRNLKETYVEVGLQVNTKNLHAWHRYNAQRRALKRL